MGTTQKDTRKLTDTSAMFHAVLDTVGEGIITIDSASMIVVVNKEVQNISSFSNSWMRYGEWDTDMLTVIEKVIFLQHVDVFSEISTEQMAYLIQEFEKDVLFLYQKSSYVPWKD